MNILVAEDHKNMGRFLQQGLKAKSYNVDLVEDGESALRRGSCQDYDLVILDVQLPNLDGYQVCRMLRDAGRRMPIIMVTSRDRLEDKLEGFSNGADDYLTKPFAFEELLARVRALLNRTFNLAGESVLQVADLILDSDSYEVTRGGSYIDLTPKEFRLLQYLLERKGRVLSRAMIEEQVWGFQKDSMTNIVDVYIRKLRKKIDTGFTPILIHTVRGVGYQLKKIEHTG